MSQSSVVSGTSEVYVGVSTLLVRVFGEFVRALFVTEVPYVCVQFIRREESGRPWVQVPRVSKK